MIRRPFMSRFRQPILDEVKFTTIRKKPWPIGVPIMAYEWSGLPYRSPQIEIAPVIVSETTLIRIGVSDDAKLIFFHPARNIHVGFHLWQSEGFFSQEEMDDWFRAKIKPGQTIERHLMRFSLIKLAA